MLDRNNWKYSSDIEISTDVKILTDNEIFNWY